MGSNRLKELLKTDASPSDTSFFFNFPTDWNSYFNSSLSTQLDEVNLSFGNSKYSAKSQEEKLIYQKISYKP
jgi:hypothetical protein